MTGEVEVAERWTEYFGELLNVAEDTIVELPTLGRGGMKSTRKKEWSGISVKEVGDVVAKLKYGKAVGLDEVSAEII